MVVPRIEFAVGFLAGLFLLSMLPTATYGYDDYEWYWVDSQNPEVQRMIREVCVFPLEDNLMLNLRILFYALGRSFRYDRANAWQPVPQLFRQRTGVCCDFARLYYSLLRGIGWPAHRIQVVAGGIYNPISGELINYHAWVEIKSPSPSGTPLALSADQSIQALEGEELVMKCNNTMVTLPEFTEENIHEIQSLGFFTRDGWIPIDPTVSVKTYGLVPLLVDLFLVFGYGMFFGMVHLDDVHPHYPNADRKNPGWDNLTVTLEPQESFNVSYLHSVERHQLTWRLTSAVNSSLPIDFEIRNPKMQVIDSASTVTSYAIDVQFDHYWEPIFPKDLGIYWFIVYNPQTEQVNVTFDAFHKWLVLWLGGEEAINQTLYDEYSRLPLHEPFVHDVATLSVTPSMNQVVQGETVEIDVTVENQGSVPETFNISCFSSMRRRLVDGAWVISMIWIDIGQQQVTLALGASITLTFTWDTSGVEACWYYDISVRADLPNDADPDDNYYSLPFYLYVLKPLVTVPEFVDFSILTSICLVIYLGVIKRRWND